MHFTLDDERIATIRIDRPRANAIGRDWLDALDAALDEAAGQAARALVITGTGRHFCAGLDLAELHSLDRAAMDAFVRHFETVFLRWFTWPRPVVAAVNGNAVAGGCVLACACDRRLGATGNYKVGTNEVPVGATFPSIALEALRCALAPAALAEVTLGGALVDPEHAVRLGLLDALVPPEELLPRAQAAARTLAASPLESFAVVKEELRAPFAERVRTHGEASRRAFIERWNSEEARAARARFV